MKDSLIRMSKVDSCFCEALYFLFHFMSVVSSDANTEGSSMVERQKLQLQNKHQPSNFAKMQQATENVEGGLFHIRDVFAVENLSGTCTL